MAKFGINDILNAKTKAAGQQAQTDGYKEIYLSPYSFCYFWHTGRRKNTYFP